MSSSTANVNYSKKRLIVCCDGTWMNSDSGYNKPTFFRPQGTLQDPSNVTRISRIFKRKCTDGTLQIICYESGVGTGSNTLDSIAGGAFGLGISERIREAYSFICANYVDGDEIILVGFSRGAFTVRSVAGMIGQIGLLTRVGIEHFYPIFKDMENWMDPKYKDPFANDPFDKKPKGAGAANAYREKLEKLGYTRVRQDDGQGPLIKIKAIAVWDTVGSLGIPQISWLSRLGIHASNKEYQFYDTSLSEKIEHAFQALAMDEPRPPFSPAVWERKEDNNLSTDLRQCWFPGNHGGCGGGWPDQGMSDITLAWMMDQLASIGVQFDKTAFEHVFRSTQDYYHGLKPPGARDLPFSLEPIFGNNSPVRPWALGAINKSGNGIYALAGSIVRSPGLYKRTNPENGAPTNDFLVQTNERIHASVRVRLASHGLGLNDAEAWDAPALKGKWKLVQSPQQFTDPVPKNPDWQPDPDAQEHVDDGNECSHGRWVWEWRGGEKDAPPAGPGRVLVEETLGPYERYLLKLAGGSPNVYQWAEGQKIPSAFC